MGSKRIFPMGEREVVKCEVGGSWDQSDRKFWRGSVLGVSGVPELGISSTEIQEFFRIRTKPVPSSSTAPGWVGGRRAPPLGIGRCAFDWDWTPLVFGWRKKKCGVQFTTGMRCRHSGESVVSVETGVIV